MKALLTFLAFFSFLVSFAQPFGFVVDGTIYNSPAQEISITTVQTNSQTHVVTSQNGIFGTFFDTLDADFTGLSVSYTFCTGNSLTEFFPADVYQNDSLAFMDIEVSYCGTEIIGCTDPEAINYNPSATFNDGSCIYPAENDLCADAIPLQEGMFLINNEGALLNEGMDGYCWAFGEGEAEQSSIWYSFTTPAENATITIESIADGTNSLTDTQFGLYLSCDGEMIDCDGNSGNNLLAKFDFSCGELLPNTTYLLQIDGYNSDQGTCYLNYSVEECIPVSGCTDPLALNYNPEATIDDGSCVYPQPCESNEVEFELITGNWAYEISWSITQDSNLVYSSTDEYTGNSTFSEILCMEDGCYSIQLMDSYGDGWNGASISASLNGEVLFIQDLPSGDYLELDFGVNVDCNEIIPEECDGETITLQVDHLYESNEEFSMVIYEEPFDTVFYQNGFTMTESVEICLEEGVCYNVNVTNNFGAASNNFLMYNFFGSDNEILSINQLEANTEFQNTTISLNGECEVEPIEDCNIDFTLIPDTTGLNTIWVIPNFPTIIGLSVNWDFGDGTTSTELFPQHEYGGNGPFNLCLTVNLTTEDGVCESTFCHWIEGDMIQQNDSTGGVQTNGFLLNVINNNNSVGIDDNIIEESLTVYPNPFMDDFNVTVYLLEEISANFNLYDISGKLIHSEAIVLISGENSINLSPGTIESGIYIVAVQTEKGNYIRKIIKH